MVGMSTSGEGGSEVEGVTEVRGGKSEGRN